MEAVPRLPMLGFKLKQSAEPHTSFNNLKLYIAELYQEDPDSYTKEVHDLETLRNIACRPSHDQDGCLKLKRYYCQLNSILHRFPLLAERPMLTFSWRDTYSNTVIAVSDLRWEMAVILYNIAALHAQLGSEEARNTPDSMKLACTHFQCAAGALEMFKERGAPPEMADLCSDLILFLHKVCLAQAQECILEKSLADNRKPGIVAKVTSQIVSYYNSALAMIIASGDDGLMADVVGSKQFKEWKKCLSFKTSYLSAILYMYQGQSAEETKKFGERVTLSQLAFDKLEEAKKEAKGISCSEQVQKALTATQEIVEAMRKAAKNENEFIYHEEVPDISTISAVQGANLVNGIAFSVTDSELLGQDIFHRLVPMKAHEGSSLYSEEKAQLLRSIGTKIEDRDAELNGFMNSLNMEFLQFDQSAVAKLPQAIVDRCASLNARPNAIPDLVALMSQLAENCGEVEMLLREIKQIFAEEEVHEKAYQQTMGQRPTVHLSELNREYQKYQEAHNKAGESNETLRKAMGLHVANLRILSKPMAEIQTLVPNNGQLAGGGGEASENPHFVELRKLLNKVTEMRGQRTQFVNTLREAINADDITSKIVAWGDNDVNDLFRQEMGKHEKTATLIDMNLVAQGNILKALTDCYAKCATAIKQMSDTKHKRDQFYSALVASYDVYEDLLGKSAKGLEFYKKLHTNVAKLLTRVKAARDVQSEERQQRLNSTVKAVPSAVEKVSSTPKLRDYMKPGPGGGYVPSSVRPSPLGSENTTTSTCVTATATDKFNSQTMTAGIGGGVGGGATTMQYGGDNAVGGGNSNSQQQNNYADHGNYYTNTQQHQQGGGGAVSVGGGAMSSYVATMGQQNPQGLTTGYVNPIYQTVGYGQQQQTTQNFNNYSAMSTASSSSSSTPSSVSVSATAGHSSSPAANSGYNNPPATGYGANQPQYSQSYATATTSSGAGGGYDASAYTNMSSSQEQQQYPTRGQYYQAPSTQANLPAYSSIPTNQSNAQPTSIATGFSSYPSSVPTSSYGSQSSGAQQQYGQQYSGYSSPAGFNAPNTSNQHQQQYSTGGSLTGPTAMTTTPAAASSNIPQVTQQMSQINVAGGGGGSGMSASDGTSASYGNYYANQSQLATGGGAGGGYNANQTTYYGQTGGGAVQYPQQQQQQQQQYGVQSSDGNLSSASTSGSQYSMGGAGGQNPSSTSHHQLSYDQNQQQQQYTNQGQYGQYNNGNQYGGSGTNNNWNSSVSTGINQQSQQQGVAQQQYAGAAVTYNTPPAGSVALTGYANQDQTVAATPPPAVISNLQTVPTNIPTPTVPAPQPSAVPPPVNNPPAAINSRNMDLLSGIDFVPPAASLPEPMLQPKPAAPSSRGNSVVGEKEKEKAPETDKKMVETKKNPVIDDDVVSVLMDDSLPPPSLAKMDHIKSFLMSAQQQSLSQSPSPSLGVTTAMDRKMSMDNISVCSEISSIDQNFDWESVSVRNESISGLGGEHEQIMSKFGAEDPKAVKWFHGEVERMEKFLEGVNIKTLNGSTPLDKKWQELQNLLAKEAGKRTTSVAKLFPEKNRSSDCIPYDHARVQLPTATDDYVNASFVKELGANCPTLILAQTPMQSTNKDFWHMVWSQKSKLIMCLHTPAEMIHPFWPTKPIEEMHFDDFTVTLLKQFDLTNCFEYNLKLTMSGSDVAHELSALQLKTWAQNVPSQVVGVARDVITSYKQRVMSESGGAGGLTSAGPIVINCLTGSKRSPLVAVTVAAVLATKAKRPLLINVVDAWFRIAAQRRGVLENEKELEYSFQVVLSNGHDLLNKHGIMTPYQVKNAQKAAVIEKEQIKDPLSELDPLWKLKK